MQTHGASARTAEQNVSETYRQRYASYLASTFHISLEAAQVEADYQLNQAKATMPVAQVTAKAASRRRATARKRPVERQ